MRDGAPIRRRGFLGGALAVAAAALAAPQAEATDYGSAREALDAMDASAAEVMARLRRVAELPAARTFAQSLLQQHERQRAERGRLRTRLALASPVSAPGKPVERSLPPLRAAMESLMFAQAEGLPALPDASAVSLVARHMVTTARHLTLLDLWQESEDARG